MGDFHVVEEIIAEKASDGRVEGERDGVPI